jgi:RNA polymerase sigma-70 factor (ECF subfamily)
MAISNMRPSRSIPHETSDEGDIAAALAENDHKRTLTLLMTRYGDRIYRYALGMTGEPQMADEIRQVVFVEAFRDLPNFAGRSPVLGWLFAIARHRCLDIAKTQRRWNRRYKHDPPDELASDDDPDRALDASRLAGLLARCMNALAPAAREAVVLRYQHELPYDEVAVLVGERIGTVQQRVARALPVLRKCVDSESRRGQP